MQLQLKLNKPPERQGKLTRQPRQEPRRMLKSCKKPEKRKLSWPIRRLRHYKQHKQLKRPLDRHTMLK